MVKYVKNFSYSKIILLGKEIVMNKKWLIIVFSFVLIILIVVITYFKLFYLPNENALRKEFFKYEPAFTKVVEFLLNDEYRDTVIDKESAADYYNNSVYFIIEDLGYQEIINDSKGSIKFVKKTNIGGSYVGLIYNSEGDKKSDNLDLYSISKIEENWYYYSDITDLKD
jgi:hypothetical protein